MSSPSPQEPWKRLYRYWLSKHVDGRPPARSDIDPIIDIPQLVSNLLLLEAEAEGYRYRLAGSEVVRQAGLDMTGRRVGYSEKYNGVITEWLAILDFVRLNQTPRLVVSHFAPDVTAKNIVLALPLHTADGTAAKLMVGSFYRGHFESGLKVEGLSVMELPLVPD